MNSLYQNENKNDLAKIMAIPFVYGIKDDKMVLRADLKTFTAIGMHEIQESLKSYAIQSKISSSNLFVAGALKVDEDTCKFEKFQNNYIQYLERQELLRFGTKNGKVVAHIRINTPSLSENHQKATMNCVQRICNKLHIEGQLTDNKTQIFGASKLFPGENAQNVLLLENETMAKTILGITNQARRYSQLVIQTL